MSRLIVVSNRTVAPGQTAAGGVATGLAEVVQRNRGVWVGWSGEVGPQREAQEHDAGDYTLLRYDLSEQEHAEFYNGFANGCLWPTLHGRDDLLDCQEGHLQTYDAVNTRVAGLIAKATDAQDRIWVHDYHFLPLAHALRERGHRGPIGLFLHVPFPEPEVYARLPGAKRLLEQLLAYDVIGFQTRRDRRNFARSAREQLGVRRHDTRLDWGEHSVLLEHIPIGIDADNFHRLATGRKANEHASRLQEALRGRRQIIGVDRLDYSKGLLHRVRAYGALLDARPELRRQIEMLQVAPVSRGGVSAYQELREELEQQVAHVNGVHGDIDWTPLRYMNRTLSRSALAGLYRGSAVGFITPLRDGMNLVAKEYVAAQDPEDPGVLVLSRYAGAAEQMDAALIVDPFRAEDCAEGLSRALLMSRDERRERHGELYRDLCRYGVHWWARQFEEALLRIAQSRDADASVEAPDADYAMA